MRREIKEFDGEKYAFDVPENEKDAILIELRKIQTYWTEKSQEERIADYILTLLDRNTKQVRKELCEDIRNFIHSGEYDNFGIEYLRTGLAVLEKLDEVQSKDS